MQHPETSDALLKRLEWSVIRPLDGLLQGDYRAWWRGLGLDLADLREYQPHDDVRHIDWNVTARLNTPYVRQYREDRDLTLWLLIDRSASVRGTADDAMAMPNGKWPLALAFAGVMARLFTRRGNRVGALLYSGRVEPALPARSGRVQVLHLLQRLRAPAAAAARGTHLGELLDAARRTLRRRSCVLVVSDFISEGDWPAALSRLSLRHDVTAIRLVDPRDGELPALGWVTVSDAETGEQTVADSLDPALRTRYAQLAAEADAQLQGTLGGTGVDTLELSSEQPLLGELLRFTDLRRRTHRFHPTSARRA